MTNFAVGKISPEACAAIERAGGTVQPSLKPAIFIASMPDAEVEDGGTHAAKDTVYIALPDGMTTLVFTRAWETEDCSLDVLPL